MGDTHTSPSFSLLAITGASKLSVSNTLVKQRRSSEKHRQKGRRRIDSSSCPVSERHVYGPRVRWPCPPRVPGYQLRHGACPSLSSMPWHDPGARACEISIHPEQFCAPTIRKTVSEIEMAGGAVLHIQVSLEFDLFRQIS